ncbi:PIG-L family deacetylase [Aureibaculum sp. 2210JD6-5]|uniref:PIG-L family deacetylase n=1 Tax=Aureibaculum sp. 2210JD6-5 TaxID=3103957 RepID=UPI002AAE4749|nr:PIG-L family deacetylase [Aureibaculum sp. 2210JD6-5]MDY7395060.1 PIG-L family deacetylase [Aureibaculum sp. 2210JD6-5]
MKKIVFLLVFLLSIIPINAQKPNKPSSSEIYESIKKLNFLGTVLYVAAHPDDENTRLISYFSNHVKARTGYLSITRGDGGQNLIGSELQELLGVIRTQELLAARHVDGGEQFFTRAKDFGYSKHPDETLAIWNKDEVLKDVVSIIRKFKPDVIINRFDHRTPGSTHGHHTSSAMLSVEAFDLVSDENFKGHNLYKPWQPKNLFFNTSWWFYGSQEKFEKADKSNLMNFDMGVYYPSSGLSNSEIASLSRSQHQSQGFGSTGSRGSEMEYIELLKGEMPKNADVFDGIDTSWNRIKGGKAIADVLTKVEQDYDFRNPAKSIPELLKAYELINKLPSGHWKSIKLPEIKEIIAACAGLYLEAVAEISYASLNDSIKVSLEAINRSDVPVVLYSIDLQNERNSFIINQNLKNNEPYKTTAKTVVLKNNQFTSPYWLWKVSNLGMYQVTDKNLIGNPETPKELLAVFNVEINGTDIPFQKDIVYKYNSPVKGEVYQPFEIFPEVTAKITNKVNIFADNSSKEIPVVIKSSKDNLSGSVNLCYPNDWKVSPDKIDFNIDNRGGEKTVVFKVTPPNEQSEGLMSPMVTIDGEIFTSELINIDYDHIPKQTVLMPSEAKLVRLDIKKKGNLIGYIQGAGDQIPTSLAQIGYKVEELNEDNINLTNLQKYDAVVLGIRLYNISDKAKFYQNALHNYVENGGTLIVQYNTSRSLKVDRVAPYELKLSRDRVVEEDAEVTLLAKDHDLLNYPNTINSSDFEGWIQERGLYFPDEWSKEFTPILSMNDKGESAKKGSLLIAKHGKGHFIYTGISFFRELPAGVPGAYKLFANMLSVGKK